MSKSEKNGKTKYFDLMMQFENSTSIFIWTLLDIIVIN